MKRLVVALLVLVPSLLLAAQLLVARLPVDQMRPVLERDLGAILDRKVRIEGPIRAHLIPWLRLELRGVVVENLEGRSSDVLLSVRRLGLEIRLFPLLRKQLVFEALEIDGVDLRIEPDASGRWPIRPSLDALDEAPTDDSDDPVRFAIRRLSMLDLQIYLDPHGWSPVHSVHVDELVLSATHRKDPIALEARGRFEGGGFDVTARLGSPAELATPTGPFPVRLDAHLIEGRLELDGHFDDPTRLAGADLRFEALLADPAARAHDLGFSVEPLGSIGLSGRLFERDGRLAIAALEAQSRDDGPLSLAVSGQIGDLVRLGGLDLRVDLAVPDARLFSGVAEAPLPEAELRMRLHLLDVDQRIRIEGDAELRAEGAFTARASGRIDDPLATPTVDLRLEADATDVEALTDAFALEHLVADAALGPVRASGHLTSRGDRLGLDSISVQVGDPAGDHAEIEGSVGDVFGPHGIELRTHLLSRDLQQLADRFGRALPPMGALDARFVLADSDGTLGLDEIELALGQPGDVFVTAKGRLGDVRSGAEIDVEAGVFLNDLDELSHVIGEELPDLGPFDYRARVQGSLDALRSTGSLRVKDTLFEGEFDRFAPTGQRARVDLRVHSPLVRLRDLITPAPAGANRPLQGRLRSEFDLEAWWQGTGRLPVETLREVDAAVRLEADRLVGESLLEVEDLVLSARLDDGLLSVDEAIAIYESGGISASVTIDATDSQPRFAGAIEAFNVDMTRLMAQFLEETVHAGHLDLSIDLSTAGATAREFRSNLDGRFGAMLRDGNLVGDYARSFAFDMLRVSVPSLKFGRDEEAPVQCFLVLFPIDGGMAEVDTFYLEGPELTVSGKGKMDLVRNAYDLRLKPELHEPGLISVATTVQVLGPLDDPVFQPIAGSMFRSAVDGLWRNSLRPIKAIDRLIRLSRRGEPEQPQGPCDEVVRHRVQQLETRHVEPIDLQEIVTRKLSDASVVFPPDD